MKLNEDERPGAPEPERFVRLRHRDERTATIQIVCLPDEAELFMQAIRAEHAKMSERLDPQPDEVDAVVSIALGRLADRSEPEAAEPTAVEKAVSA